MNDSVDMRLFFSFSSGLQIYENVDSDTCVFP